MIDTTDLANRSDTDSAVRDPERLAAVRRTGLLDSDSEEVFDRLTRLAARIVRAPAAFISLVDENRDFYKSAFGFGEPLASAREMVGPTFCHYAIQSSDPLVIGDTRTDPEYCNVPTVSSLGVAAYVGVPLVTADEQAIGSFCAIDFEPRTWTPDEIEVLRELAQSAMREIELRREVAERRQAETEVRAKARMLAFGAEVGSAVIEGGALTAVLERCANAVVEHLRAATARIWTRDERTGALELRACAGLPATSGEGASATVRSIAERCAPLVTNEVRTDLLQLDGERADGAGHTSFAGYPLVVEGRVLGVLELFSRNPLSENDTTGLQTVADQIALAIARLLAEEAQAELLEREREARAEAERGQQALERVTESRARLMRGFSHDLKNPLGAADGHAQLLEDEILGPINERQRGSVIRIRKLIRSSLDLLEDLVELARAEAGQIEVELGRTDAREVVRELVEEYAAQMEAAGLSLRTDFPADFPAVRSDPGRVRQILGNLISNAIKYNRPGGSITVGTGLTPRAGDGGECVAVWVQDSGEGIPQDKLGLLFQEFSRLHATSSKPGAGLGLAISQRVAAALGGEITVESTPGEGSTFTLWLPLDPA